MGRVVVSVFVQFSASVFYYYQFIKTEERKKTDFSAYQDSEYCSIKVIRFEVVILIWEIGVHCRMIVSCTT